MSGARANRSENINNAVIGICGTICYNIVRISYNFYTRMKTMSGFDNFQYIIAEERRRAKMTQETLARALGVTPQAVSKWENGIGYPDVTLFPDIARVLGVPIERLFGEVRRGTQEKDPPAEYAGMPLICRWKSNLCYSSKQAVSIDEQNGKVEFADGSTADLSEGCVINCGAGEVRIFQAEEIISEDSGTNTEVPFDASQIDSFEEMKMSLGWPCTVKICKPDGGGRRVLAQGSERFIRALKVSTSAGRLTVEMSNHHGNIHRSDMDCNCLTIYTEFTRGRLLELSLNDVGKCTVEPDFDRAKISINGSGSVLAEVMGEAGLHINGSGSIQLKAVEGIADLKINGSGNIQTKQAGAAKVHINGSGDITLGDVKGPSEISINGSGDVGLNRSNGTKIKINGSGDVDFKHLSGSAEAHIAGSGDISCAGEIETLKLRIQGSGDFHGAELIVGESDIKTRDGSSAEIDIGRIRGRSVEHLAKETVLRVRQRG